MARPVLVDALRPVFARLDGDDGAATLVCGVAEGADLAAAEACPEGWDFELVYPDDPDAWISRFDDEEQRIFDGLTSRSSRIVLPHADGPAFGALADHLVETTDRLVVVWDGQPGLPGGTGDVVSRAKARGLEVIFIRIAHGWPQL